MNKVITFWIVFAAYNLIFVLPALMYMVANFYGWLFAGMALDSTKFSYATYWVITLLSPNLTLMFYREITK